MKKSTPSDDFRSKSTCPRCGKRIVPAERAGSLTSYLFQSFNCTCSPTQDRGQAAPLPLGQTKGSERCPDCGLKLPEGKKAGSITAFLFQDIRCRCEGRRPAANSQMAQMFWQLKRTGAGTTFSSSTTGSRRTGRTNVDLIDGVIIGGTYKIIRLIGKGGMGEVYQAEHMTLGKKCALKVIPPDQVTEVGWQRFQAEAKSIAKLDHINLVKVSDLGIHEGCLPYYAMEYIDGKNLCELIQQRGCLPLDTVLPIFMQICDAVGYAHRNGMVHRDLKPENIMLERAAGNKVSVKILDFGLVKLTQSDRNAQSLTAVGEIFGSPFYMSPEQCIGGKIDNRTDIYSVGCVLFECLTGRPPFIAPTSVEVMTSHQSADPPTLESVLGRKTLPEDMDVILAKLLRKNPVERYQTFGELRGDLEKVQKGEAVEPFYVSRAKKTTDARAGKGDKKSEQHSPARPVLIAFVIAFVLLAGAGAFFVVAIKHMAGKKIPTSGKTDFDLPKLSQGQGEKDKDEFLIDFTNSMGKSTKKRHKVDFIDTTPFSTLASKNGRAVRIFEFPAGKSFGRLKLDDDQQVFAQGTVEVPANVKITFNPNPILIEHPEYMARFRPGEIYEVKLLLNPEGDNDALLLACSQLRGVKRLDLISCNDLSQKSIFLVDKFESLESLRLVADADLVADMAKLSAIRKVGQLAIFGDSNIEPLISGLGNSSNLYNLNLQFPFLSNQALAAIAALPNLDTLSLESETLSHTDFTNRVLQILSKAPKLRRLCLSGAVIDEQSLSILKTYKCLAKLQLDPPKGYKSQTGIIARALPNLKLVRFNTH